MGWSHVPELQAGQILTAEHMNRVLRNQEYLYSLEPFGSPMFRCVEHAAGGTESTAWVGWLRHWQRNFRWQIKVTAANTVGGTGTYYFKIQIDWSNYTFGGVGGSDWTDLMQSGDVVAGTVYSGTTDMAASPGFDGLYAAGRGKGRICKVRVQARNCTVEVQALYTVDALPASRGGYDWQGLPSIGNTFVLTTAQWNTFRNDLLYLRDQLAAPWAPTAENQDFGGLDPDGVSKWRSFFQHRSDWIAYRIGGWTDSLDNTWGYPVTAAFVLGGTRYPIGTNLFDLGKGNHYSGEVYTEGIDRGNLPSPHKAEDRLEYIPNSVSRATNPMPALTKGTWYEFVVYRRATGQDVQGGNTQPITGLLNHCFEVQGSPNTSGWNVLSPFSHGDYPAGDLTSTMQRLVDNLNTLKTRIDGTPALLCWEGNTDKYHYRRGDLLLWSGTNVNLEYVKNRIPVGSGVIRQKVELGTSPNNGNDPAILDLRALGDMPYGAYYVVVGARYTFEALE